MIEAGQFLDDAEVIRLRSTYRGGGDVNLVFASFVEDNTRVDLETDNFYYQPPDEQVGTDCPLCSNRITIYLLDFISITGTHILCMYCADCDLLFRSRMIGRLDDYGNFTAEECIK